MTVKTILLSVSLLTISTNALAEDEILVEGTRLSQPLSEVGSSVTVITAEEIDALGLAFAADAIASAPGVTVNTNGAFGGTASIRLRGAASEQTLVLIDGVPVNDTASPGGGFDFARLDTENIERIEILRGAQSTLWGSDAIGGVVSITTKRAADGIGGSAFAEYGSFGTWRGGASFERGTDQSDLRLAVTGITSDGISKADEANGNSEEDPYDAMTLSTSGGLTLGPDARLSADLLWTEATTAFDSFVFGAQGNVGDGDETSETEELSANIALTAPLFQGRLDNTLRLGHSDITRDNFTIGAPSFSADGARTILRYQGDLSLGSRQRLAIGAEREDTEADGTDASINGLFALYEMKPTQAFTLTTGLRMDDHSKFGSQTTGRAALAWAPTPPLSLRASWGQGFKAPTIFQTTFFCCGATAPNADLQPETSEGYDLGADWRSADGRTGASATWFSQDTENLIDFSFALGGYENIAEVSSQGWELAASHQVTGWLGLSMNYTNTDAENGAGDPLIRLPEHAGQVTATLDPDGPVSGALRIRHNGEERNSDGTTLDGWTRVDLSGQYDISERLEVSGRIENLLDTEYQQVLGYGTPGLSGSLRLRLRY